MYCQLLQLREEGAQPTIREAASSLFYIYVHIYTYTAVFAILSRRKSLDPFGRYSVNREHYFIDSTEDCF